MILTDFLISAKRDLFSLLIVTEIIVEETSEVFVVFKGHQMLFIFEKGLDILLVIDEQKAFTRECFIDFWAGLVAGDLVIPIMDDRDDRAAAVYISPLMKSQRSASGLGPQQGVLR